MPTDRFDNAFHVSAPAGEIYAHLIEPQSYVGLSPLLVAVREVRPGRDEQQSGGVRLRIGESLHRHAVQNVRAGR